MEAPAITRRRRPFLAPIWLSALLAAIVFGLAAVWLVSAATTTFIVVRHAEKMFGTIDDPPLAPAGELRAQQLARMLGQPGSIGSIKAVYVSEARCAQQTAAPLLARLGQRAHLISGRNIGGLVRRLPREHRGETVMIVGQSNTVPLIIHELAGVDVPPIGEDEYDNLYVVSIPALGIPGIVRLRY